MVIYMYMCVTVILSTEELITLLGSGSLGEEDLEELIAITGRSREETTRIRDGRPSTIYNDPLVAQEIRSWVTLADRAATGSSSTLSYGSMGGGSTSGTSSKTKGGSHRKDGSGGTVLHFENPTYWKEDNVCL